VHSLLFLTAVVSSFTGQGLAPVTPPELTWLQQTTGITITPANALKSCVSLRGKVVQRL
jgi:hypothetical protein